MENTYELQSHQKSNQIKWIITAVAFVLVFVLIGGLFIALFRSDDNKDEKSEQTVKMQTCDLPETSEKDNAGVVDGEGNSMEEAVVYAMPTAMSFSENKLIAAIAAGTSVDVKVSVNVYPTNAADKSVDFSVAWGAAPTNGTKAVTDYLTVTPDSDGSTSATVSCKKAFGNDQIIITATTRDGGFTATCTVMFVGKASSMSVTSSSLTAKSNTGRGTYYELGTNRTYTFNVNLSNVFNSVGSKNLSVTLGGSGSLYFGTMTVNGSGISTFSNMAKQNMSALVSKFITSATISGTTLTIQTGRTYIENYYSSTSEDFLSGTSTYSDRYVYNDISGLMNGTNYSTNASSNQSALPSCYFTVTVTDSVSGLSQTIRLWLVSAVSSVSFSQRNLSF